MAEIGDFLWGVIPWSVLGVLLWQSRRWPGPLSLPRCAVGWVISIWVVSQLLGLGNALAPVTLRICWSAVLGGVAYFCWRQRAERPFITRGGGWLPPEPWVRLILGLSVLLLGWTLVKAFVSPPNTVDVLSYHLPRQLLWLQQGSLDFYPTINDRENMMPPLAEVIGVQFLAITGDDRWANVIGWAAYAGSAWAAASLARLLGARRVLAAAAGLAVLLVPMSYHEAANAKNDLPCGFFLLCFTVELAWLVRRGLNRLQPRDALCPALALSAAWLTKSTTLIIAPALLFCAGIALFCQARVGLMVSARRLLRPAALASVVVLLCIAPFHLRNLSYYGDLLGQHRAEDGGAQANTASTPAVVASNLLRHATVHLLLPWPAWNESWLSVVRSAHDWISADIDDQRTTLWGFLFRPAYLPEFESYAGAPAHFLIGSTLLVLSVFVPGRRRARWCACAVVLGAFGMVLALKWQPWLARLHQGLFFIGIAAVAASWQPLLSKGWARVGLVLTLGLLICAWWPSRETEGRRMWGDHSLFFASRDANYLNNAPGTDERLQALSRTFIASGARSVLMPNIHDVTYPLMRTLLKSNPSTVFAEVSRRGAPPLPAEALVMMRSGQVQPLWRDYGGRTDWRLVGLGIPQGGVYLPPEKVKALGWADSLPIFAGWLPESGLANSHAMTFNGQIIPCVIFTEDVAVIVIPPLAHGGELRGAFLGAPFSSLHLYWGRDTSANMAEELSLRWGEGAPTGTPFAVVLPRSTSSRQLSFRLPTGVRPCFTRLQIQDDFGQP